MRKWQLRCGHDVIINMHVIINMYVIINMPTDSLPSHKSTSGSLGWGGVGWGGIITLLAFPHEPDATLYDLQLKFHMNLMLRSMIFNCNSTHPYPIVWGGVGGVGWDNNVIGISTWTWCYAVWSSLAFPHDLDATLCDLNWHFHMNLMLRSMIFNCNSTWSWCYVLWSSSGISTWSWCYALWSSLTFPHEPDATFYDLQLQFHKILMLRSMIFNWHFHMILMLRSMIFNWHFHMILMLRSMIFNCNSTWSWCYALWSSIGISTWSSCYALWSSIAIPHDLDATLYDLQWHFHMNLMLRSMIFNCNSTWSWCYVLWSSIGISTWTWCYALWSSIAIPHDLDATLYDLQLAFPHDLDATLYDLQLQFHMILMLRSMIFNCNSTWSWCYALWSSLAFPHEPDATLYDLQLEFHMNLMLRSMIFIGISTWTWCYALWSSMWEKVVVALFEAEVMEGFVIPKEDGRFFW